MKSPAKQGTVVMNVVFKCVDCGDLSHSQESLNVHRAVCHSSGKSQEVSDTELLDESDLTKTEQIADACNCPKCGEHFLLLRPHSFNCALCQFHDVDQERFFVHLKGHYEPHSVLTVDPGSVIIEQVIDDTTDVNRPDPDDRLGADPESDDEPDDHDEEYVPDNDEETDDEEPTTTKRKDEMSRKSPGKSGTPLKRVSFATPEKLKSVDAKTTCSKIGIVWAQKKLNFVKMPASSKPEDKVKSPSRSVNGAQTSTPYKSILGTPVTIKEEPNSSDESEDHSEKRVASSKWVRLEDIKFIGGPVGSARTPKGAHSKNTAPSKATQPGKSPTKESVAVRKKAPPKPKDKTPKEKKPREQKIPVCGICKRIFATNQSLKNHLAIHTGERNYACEHCGKAFTQWSTCQQHIEAIHLGNKKYTCEFCGACFARSSSIKTHRRIHTGEVLHHCNVCNKGFRAKSYLDRHRTLHTGEKRFRCEFCSKLFRTSTDMKRHRNSVHFGLGNISLTQAREILQTRMEGYIRTPTQRPSATVIQRFVEGNSESSDDSEEVLRATTVIAEPRYEEL